MPSTRHIARIHQPSRVELPERACIKPSYSAFGILGSFWKRALRPGLPAVDLLTIAHSNSTSSHFCCKHSPDTSVHHHLLSHAGVHEPIAIGVTKPFAPRLIRRWAALAPIYWTRRFSSQQDLRTRFETLCSVTRPRRRSRFTILPTRLSPHPHRLRSLYHFFAI